MEFEVRRAGAEDAAIIHAITRKSYAEYLGVLNPPQKAQSETVEDVAQAIALGGAGILFADGLAVGSVRFARVGEDVLIERLAVLPEPRRQGAAKALLAFAEAQDRAAGARMARLGVRLRLAGNVLLYRSQGYQRRRKTSSLRARI
ncbi:MAG: GNAT family N-acetyltransferase [Thermaerobacter sp.]|nr:GNAT family N-acetyltransferase [Thermaerobacter sp.]